MAPIVNLTAKLHRMEPYDQLNEQADIIFHDILRTLTQNFPQTRRFLVSFLHDTPPPYKNDYIPIVARTPFGVIKWHLRIYSAENDKYDLVYHKIYPTESVASIGHFNGLIIRWPGNNFILKPSH